MTVDQVTPRHTTPAGQAPRTRSARRDRRGEQSARGAARRRNTWTLTSPPLRYAVESLDHWLDLSA
jgi:hypothetical protein